MLIQVTDVNNALTWAPNELIYFC